MKKENLENLRRCPHFTGCNQNLCLLDSELPLRTGGEKDKCRWMREQKKVKVKGKEFISGGSVMPNAILKFVPGTNLKWLNGASKMARLRIKTLQT